MEDELSVYDQLAEAIPPPGGLVFLLASLLAIRFRSDEDQS
jgi:hypothetical protein